MKLSELLPDEGIQSKSDPRQIEITCVCDHTDDIVRGALFVAIRGTHIDPISLLDVIEEKGAAALLLPVDVDLPRPPRIPCFFAKELPALVPKLWARYYREPSKGLRLFAVTGTNGKTTTALILTHLLNSAGIPTAYIGTLGTSFQGKSSVDRECGMTTPSAHHLQRRLRMLADDGASAVVLEVSSHAVAQKRVAGLSFESVIFTNLTQEHLDYHKTMENYFAAKRALFDQAKLAVINRDDDYGERLLLSLACPKKSVAVIDDADYTISDLHEMGDEGTEYQCCTPFGNFTVYYPLFGAFNVYNTLLAIATAVHAGLCPFEITKALASLEKPKGRLEKLPLGKEYSVIIDYAHTPDAMENAIKAAAHVTKARLFVLFGAGGDREREKRAKMGEIACRLATHAFITRDNPREESETAILEDILKDIRERSNYTVIQDRAIAIRAAMDALRTGDTLLLLGKGHEEYMISGREKTPFSEREVVYDYLRKKEEK